MKVSLYNVTMSVQIQRDGINQSFDLVIAPYHKVWWINNTEMNRSPNFTREDTDQINDLVDKVFALAVEIKEKTS